MKIRTVYLAGGINGLSDEDANAWRREAASLLPRSVAILDPMSRDYRGKEDENVGDIVRGDLADIRSCDLVIAHCARPSWGTAMEIHYAATTGSRITVEVGGDGEYGGGETRQIGTRRVVAIVPGGAPVSPWLRYHTDAVVASVQEAVAWVVANNEDGEGVSGTSPILAGLK